MRQKIVILGSTGSIGRNALAVAAHLQDRIEVVALAAGKNIERLAEQVAVFHPQRVVIADAADYHKARALIPENVDILIGIEGMCEVVADAAVDTVLCAVLGTAGLLPVITAIQHGKRIALASKEVMVMAGDWVQELLRKHHAELIPVDSEHSAIFQCLHRGNPSDVRRLILTASGGPFRNMTSEQMASITPEQACMHPTWQMGRKITIDSATMMNKALELIEAQKLFNVPEAQITVTVHPQSMVHSMVEFVDGTLMAQLSTPDMKAPIQYAFTYPQRVEGLLKPLDFSTFTTLTFEPPDETRFPALRLARQCCRSGGCAPAILNAANEVAVARFCRREISFTHIAALVEETLNNAPSNGTTPPDLDAILAADAWARHYTQKLKI